MACDVALSGVRRLAAEWIPACAGMTVCRTDGAAIFIVGTKNVLVMILARRLARRVDVRAYEAPVAKRRISYSNKGIL